MDGRRMNGRTTDAGSWVSYKLTYEPLAQVSLKVKLEFMFMKHYAPNRCEPSIEALNFFWGEGGGIREDVNGEVKYL